MTFPLQFGVYLYTLFFLKSSNGILSVDSGILMLFEKYTRVNKINSKLNSKSYDYLYTLDNT